MTVAARKIRLIMRLRRAGISDTNVLSAIERIPREAFVPDSFLDQPYEDRTLPIGHGQTLSQPRVVALMTQALEIDRRIKVLEIGTADTTRKTTSTPWATRPPTCHYTSIPPVTG